MKKIHYSIVRMTHHLTATRRNSILPKRLVRNPQVKKKPSRLTSVKFLNL
jgi:hypothetical protein